MTHFTKALAKVATSVTRLTGRHLSGNKTGNSAATDWQHIGLAGLAHGTANVSAEQFKQLDCKLRFSDFFQP
jgi:hypothetical protein